MTWNHRPMRRLAYYGLLLAAFATACSHGGSGLLPGASSPGLLTPKSVSPGLIKPPPMAQTEILPPGAMKSPVHPNIPVSTLGWSQVPGTASAVAAAPDGSLWVLSDQPAGADKYIWHYANGGWTNISGMASAIAAAPDGSLWAINAEAASTTTPAAPGLRWAAAPATASLPTHRAASTF